jgi:hypothetical protein
MSCLVVSCLVMCCLCLDLSCLCLSLLLVCLVSSCLTFYFCVPSVCVNIRFSNPFLSVKFPPYFFLSEPICECAKMFPIARGNSKGQIYPQSADYIDGKLEHLEKKLQATIKILLSDETSKLSFLWNLFKFQGTVLPVINTSSSLRTIINNDFAFNLRLCASICTCFPNASNLGTRLPNHF